MTLLDKQGKPTAKVISQQLKDTTDTVYNFEVQDFHTYHIGEVGVWVHNAKCCDIDVTGTTHGNDNFTGRGFTKNKVEDIANNYSEKGYQPGGLTVYIKKKPNGQYDVIVVNRENKLVTAVGGNTGSLPNRKAVVKMLNNNGGFSGVPLD